MSRYDLREYHPLTWVKFLTWFRLGFSVFVVVLCASTVYGVYTQATSTKLSVVQLIGAALVFVILGLFGFLMVLVRSPATSLIIDETGVRLEFKRGPPDVRLWIRESTVFRGRYTTGVSDSVSRGNPLWSIYGRLGAIPESFIPGAAFDNLVQAAKSHGFTVRERRGRPGWILYTIKANSSTD